MSEKTIKENLNTVDVEIKAKNKESEEIIIPNTVATKARSEEFNTQTQALKSSEEILGNKEPDQGTKAELRSKQEKPKHETNSDEKRLSNILSVLIENTKERGAEEKLTKLELTILKREGVEVDNETTLSEAVEKLKKIKNKTRPGIEGGVNVTSVKLENTTKITNPENSPKYGPNPVELLRMKRGDLEKQQNELLAEEEVLEAKKKDKTITKEENRRLKELEKEIDKTTNTLNEASKLFGIRPDKREGKPDSEIESREAVEILRSLDEKQKEILDEAEKIGERGFIERMADGYNKMKPWKKIGITTALLGGGLALNATGLSTMAGLALITASRGLGGIGKFAKYKKMLESEDGRGGLNEHAGKLQKFFDKVDGFVVDGMRKSEWVRKHPRIAASIVGWAHFGIFTGGFVQLADYLDDKLSWVKDVFDEAEFPEADISTAQEVGLGTETNIEELGIDDVEISPETKTPNGGEYFELSVNTSDKGAIRTFVDLKEALRDNFPDAENRPELVTKILEKDAIELAKEYGFYKPGQEAESAMLMDGDTIKLDSNGNLVYETAGGEKTVLESATTKSGQYEGEMFDYQAQKEIVHSQQEQMEGVDVTKEAPFVENTESIADIEKIAQIEQMAKKAMADDINEMYGSGGIFGFGEMHGLDSAIWKKISNLSVSEVLDSEPVEGVDMEEDWSRTMREYIHNIMNMESLYPKQNETVSQFIERAHKIRIIRGK